METPPKDGQWMVSNTPDYFDNGQHFDSKQEAIDFGLKEYSGDYTRISCLYLGQVETLGLGVVVDIKRILKDVGQSLYVDTGFDGVEDYLSHTKKEHNDELEEELVNVIISWIVRHNYQPTCYYLTNVEKVDVS